MYRRSIFTGFFSITLVACTFTTPPPTATPVPTATFTFVPTFMPTLIRTSTPAPVTLIVKDKLINCRFGPGVTYELINEFSQGESAQVVGKDESSSWWYVSDPGNPKGHCWVSADVTEAHGAVEEVPVLQSPVTTVISASLRIEPDRIVVSCHQFPQTIFLEAKVTSNGPTYVTWRWEASTGVSSNDTVMVFEQAGTQIINDYYQIGAPNDYWIKLHIVAPNELIETVNFPVSCT
jgi:SH3-like domain-containing protein